MSRLVKSSASLASGWTLQAALMLIGVAATPWLLHWLGEERFGAYRAASEWLAHLALLELGLSAALLPVFSKAFVSGDAAVRGALRVSFRVYVQLAALMLAGSLVMVWLIPRLVPTDAEIAQEMRHGVLIACCGVLAFPLAPLISLLHAAQRTYWVHAMNAVQSLLITTLSLTFAYWGWGVTGQFSAAMLGLVTAHLLLCVFAERTVKGALRQFRHLGRRPKDEEVRKELFRLNWPMFVMTAAGRMALFADNSIVAYFAGPAPTAQFYLTRRLCDAVSGYLLVIGNVCWAALSELVHQGQMELMRRRMLQALQMVMVVGFAVLIPVAAFNHAFVALWVGPRNFGGETATALAAANVLALSLGSLMAWLYAGTGRIHRLLRLLLVTSALNVLVGVGLSAAAARYAPEWVLVGPLVGTFAAVAGMQLPCLARLLCLDFQFTPGLFFRVAFRPGLLACVWIPLAYWLSHVREWGWIGMGLAMSGLALGYLGLSWQFVLSTEERTDWHAMFGRLLRR